MRFACSATPSPLAVAAAIPALAIALAGATGCDSSSTRQARAQGQSRAGGVVVADDANQAGASDRYQETTFDDVKFDLAPGAPFRDELITPQIAARFDRPIRIRGYMFPTLRKSGLKQFVLVRDNLECCFGPGAALFDCILVYLDPNHPAEYSIRPVTVEGVFKFDKRQMAPDAPPIAIYRLDDAAVK